MSLSHYESTTARCSFSPLILGRAASVGELAAWRERRQYSADPITTAVTP